MLFVFLLPLMLVNKDYQTHTPTKKHTDRTDYNTLRRS